MRRAHFFLLRMQCHAPVKHGSLVQTVHYKIVDKVMGVRLANPEYKSFRLGGYKTSVATDLAEHVVIYRPSLGALGNEPLVRINSACFTGDIFGDQRCECSEQLKAAMDCLKQEPGLIIYHLHHEGRGIGLTAKLRTYKRMERDRKVSTFQAMEELVNRDDLRTYGSAVLILRDLGIHRLRLMTNNPDKKLVLEKNGIEVVQTIGLISKRPGVQSYLRSKRDVKGHFIGSDVVLNKPSTRRDGGPS